MFGRTLPPLVFGLLLLATWDIVTRTGAVAEFYLPAPPTWPGISSTRCATAPCSTTPR
ncbi:hypothetical protein NKH77_20595 [Streptomyces sp. M19]